MDSSVISVRLGICQDGICFLIVSIASALGLFDGRGWERVRAQGPVETQGSVSRAASAPGAPVKGPEQEHGESLDTGARVYEGQGHEPATRLAHQVFTARHSPWQPKLETTSVHQLTSR